MSRYGAAAVAAEEILRDLFKVQVWKALDPLNVDDFITISARLSSALKSATKGVEGQALTSAIESLDVDWPNLSDAGRDKIIAAARAEVAGVAEPVETAISPVLDTAASRIIPATKTQTIGKFGLDIPQALGDLDTETSKLLRVSQMVYIKDQYGARADVFDTMAKDIVAGGLEQGLGRDDISGNLATKLADYQINRSANYWDLIATDFSNKARTTTQLHAFGEAGITKYRLDAILDEVTSEICRLLHGRVFSVKKAAARSMKALSATDPEDIKTLRPWVVSGKDSSGKDVLYYNGAGDTRHTVAEVDEGAEGVKDKVGKYSNTMSNKALEAAGVSVPPFHGHCRTTIETVE